MTLGLDFYDTITSNVPRFKDLAQTIINGGGEVYIITAVKAENEERVRREIARSNIPHSGVEVVVYDKYRQIPKLKLERCRLHHIDFLIDDRQDTCKFVTKYGYTALSITKKVAK